MFPELIHSEFDSLKLLGSFRRLRALHKQYESDPEKLAYIIQQEPADLTQFEGPLEQYDAVRDVAYINFANNDFCLAATRTLDGGTVFNIAFFSALGYFVGVYFQTGASDLSSNAWFETFVRTIWGFFAATILSVFGCMLIQLRIISFPWLDTLSGNFDATLMVAAFLIGGRNSMWQPIFDKLSLARPTATQKNLHVNASRGIKMDNRYPNRQR